MEEKISGCVVKEGWFILTSLGSLTSAIAAYQKRMGIEEMFRDYKSGGYYRRLQVNRVQLILVY